MKNILVTGGAGFIGATLVPMLIEQNYSVHILDDLSVGTKETHAGLDVQWHVGDIRDDEFVNHAMAGMDGVVHLAAHTNVIDSQTKPRHDFEVNVGGTLNLLLAAREQGVSRFVMASSNAPIGENEPPIDESKPARPLSPYGASKLAGEGYCSAFHGSYGLGTVVLRFANVYGPRSTHKGSVVAKFIKDAMNDGALTIYGDGLQTRDFVHVADLSREMIQTALPERSIQIVHEGQRAGEIIKNYSSIEKARRMLGWEPQILLADGLAETVDFFVSK